MAGSRSDVYSINGKFFTWNGDEFVDMNAGEQVFPDAVTLSGVILMTGVPTSDPVNAGQVWSNSGVLTISSGS